MRKAPILFAPLVLIAGCATTPPPSDNGLSYAKLGQTVYVDGPRVTPLSVIEDSRCPKDVVCVWAGRLRISARIDLGSRSETRELTLGQPQQIADGSLELVEAAPYPMRDRPATPAAYRFGFRFMGGL